MDSSGTIYWRCDKCDRMMEAGTDCYGCGAEDETEKLMTKEFESLMDKNTARATADLERDYKKLLKNRGKRMGLK